MNNFWKQLEPPFFVLAPMAEVTDVAFREFITQHGKPDALFTEFVSARGLLSEKGKKVLIRDLWYTEKQRPIVAQIFGGEPEDIGAVAAMIEDLGFDGIDINMGCPDKKVEKQGAGAALIRDPSRAQECVYAAKEKTSRIPVSVKTRIGYNTIETEKWIGAILRTSPHALTIHLRTRKEMSLADAHWEEMDTIMKLAEGKDTVIIGNGDVNSREEGEQYYERYGMHGIMVGRGVYGNPWIFRPNSTSHSHKERIMALVQFALLYNMVWKNTKNYEILKRYFKSYIYGFEGAKQLREKLMGTKNVETFLDIVRSYYDERGWNYQQPKASELRLAKSFQTDKVL